jgi:hypothetical protein
MPIAPPVIADDYCDRRLVSHSNLKVRYEIGKKIARGFFNSLQHKLAIPVQVEFTGVYNGTILCQMKSFLVQFRRIAPKRAQRTNRLG